jgi:hypothetical protein
MIDRWNVPLDEERKEEKERRKIRSKLQWNFEEREIGKAAYLSER